MDRYEELLEKARKEYEASETKDIPDYKKVFFREMMDMIEEDEIDEDDIDKILDYCNPNTPLENWYNMYIDSEESIRNILRNVLWR